MQKVIKATLGIWFWLLIEHLQFYAALSLLPNQFLPSLAEYVSLRFGFLNFILPFDIMPDFPPPPAGSTGIWKYCHYLDIPAQSFQLLTLIFFALFLVLTFLVFGVCCVIALGCCTSKEQHTDNRWGGSAVATLLRVLLLPTTGLSVTSAFHLLSFATLDALSFIAAATAFLLLLYPVSISLVVFLRRRDLRDPQTQLRFGGLYRKYNPHNYLFFLVYTAKRIAIGAVIGALASQSLVCLITLVCIQAMYTVILLLRRPVMFALGMVTEVLSEFAMLCSLVLALVASQVTMSSWLLNLLGWIVVAGHALVVLIAAVLVCVCALVQLSRWSKKKQKQSNVLPLSTAVLSMDDEPSSSPAAPNDNSVPLREFRRPRGQSSPHLTPSAARSLSVEVEEITYNTAIQMEIPQTPIATPSKAFEAFEARGEESFGRALASAFNETEPTPRRAQPAPISTSQVPNMNQSLPPSGLLQRRMNKSMIVGSAVSAAIQSFAGVSMEPMNSVMLNDGAGLAGRRQGFRPPSITIAPGPASVLQDSGLGREWQEKQERESQLTMYDNICSKIVEGVYVSSAVVAGNMSMLREHGITHIINCVGQACTNHFPEQIEYLTFYLSDSHAENVTCVFYDTIDFITRARQAGGRVMLHCKRGISRSCALTMAYLMYTEKTGLRETLANVQKARAVASPNGGFFFQLQDWSERLARLRRMNITPLPADDLRLYRVCLQSVREPRSMLVAKVLPAVDGASLDPRGVFILQPAPPRPVSIWIGAQARPCHVVAARLFVARLQKYEAAPQRFIVERQGTESDEFWSYFPARPVGMPTPVKEFDKDYPDDDLERVQADAMLFRSTNWQRVQPFTALDFDPHYIMVLVSAASPASIHPATELFVWVGYEAESAASTPQVYERAGHQCIIANNLPAHLPVRVVHHSGQQHEMWSYVPV